MRLRSPLRSNSLSRHAMLLQTTYGCVITTPLDLYLIECKFSVSFGKLSHAEHNNEFKTNLFTRCHAPSSLIPL